jgi:biopolymer transport protein ExbD
MKTSRVSLETWLNLFALDLSFVMLVVLVIFMTITPLVPFRPWVDTPVSTSAVKSPEGYRDLTVSIPIAGRFFLENEAVPINELDRRFASAPGHKDFVVRIRAGRRVPFGDVRKVVQAAREAGITHVTLMFNAPPPPRH